MSNNNQDWLDDDEFDFDLDEVEDETPRRGSKDNDALRKVRRAERAKDKQLKELQVELESLRKFQRESTISKVLHEKNINPKIAALIPGDLDGSLESINLWLEQYGDIFGVQQVQQSNGLNEADIATLRQIDAATSGAYSLDDTNDLFGSINNAQSQEELLELLYRQGME
jgi:hypothetical protein